MNPNSDCSCDPIIPDLVIPEQCGESCAEISSAACVTYQGDNIICDDGVNPPTVLFHQGDNFGHILNLIGTYICAGFQGTAATLEIQEVWIQYGSLGVVINDLPGSTAQHRLYEITFTIPEPEQGIQGEQGETGSSGYNGTHGDDGADGAPGQSAYQLWLDSGGSGTEAEFLLSLVGATGATGGQGEQGVPGVSNLAGPAGTSGTDGTNGTNGDTITEITSNSNGTITVYYGGNEWTSDSLLGPQGIEGPKGEGCDSTPALVLKSNVFKTYRFTGTSSGYFNIPFRIDSTGEGRLVTRKFTPVDPLDEVFRFHSNDDEDQGIYEIHAEISCEGMTNTNAQLYYIVNVDILVRIQIDKGGSGTWSTSGYYKLAAAGNTRIGNLLLNLRTALAIEEGDEIKVTVAPNGYPPEFGGSFMADIRFSGRLLTIQKVGSL